MTEGSINVKSSPTLNIRLRVRPDNVKITPIIPGIPKPGIIKTSTVISINPDINNAIS